MVFLYRRIFPTRAVRLGSTILGAVCIAWFLATEVANLIVLYKPPAGTTQGRLALARIGSIVTSACNCVIDAATVALPVRDVCRLQLTRQKRLGVFGIFLLGGM